MRRGGPLAELDLDMLTGLVPFSLATDEDLIVTWASRAKMTASATDALMPAPL